MLSGKICHRLTKEMCIEGPNTAWVCFFNGTFSRPASRRVLDTLMHLPKHRTVILITTSSRAARLQLHPTMGSSPILIQVDIPEDDFTSRGVTKW